MKTPHLSGEFWNSFVHEKLWTAVLFWVLVAGVCVVVANALAAAV